MLDDEGLHTLLCEIETVSNDRPITKNTDQHSDLEPLTPNHFPLMLRKPNLPTVVFDKADTSLKTDTIHGKSVLASLGTRILVPSSRATEMI